MITIIIIIIATVSNSYGQTCRNLPVYSNCSTNTDCGCLPFTLSDDKNGICAYLHLAQSKLRTCDQINSYCDQLNTVCIRHPNLSTNQSFCYPTVMASLDICPPLNSMSSSILPPIETVDFICINATWSKRGVTVAGSNFTGNRSHELRNPMSILYDTKSNLLYVGDAGNARIVTWGSNAKYGLILAGDNGQGNRTDQFGTINDILMDPKDRSLIICDARNRRIIRWTRRAQQGKTLINNIYCSGLALDNEGLLYVSEYDNHRITRWTLAGNTAIDKIVAGGNGKGVRLDQLYEPSGIFVDRNRTVYVADFSNDRIMKWVDGATEGTVVGKLRWPKIVDFDQSERMYSIDGYYNRIVRWTSNNLNGTIIIGEQQYTLSQPADIAFDQDGNIYVSNYGSSRIDKYDIDRSKCQ